MESNQIEVKLFAGLRENRGKVLHIEASTVLDAVDKLAIEHEDAHLILVNGRDATFETPLKAGDTLSIFPRVGGG